MKTKLKRILGWCLVALPVAVMFWMVPEVALIATGAMVGTIGFIFLTFWLLCSDEKSTK